MNKQKLEQRRDKAIADLQLYDACDEVFRLLRDNKIKGIQLDQLMVTPREIRHLSTFTDEEGPWEAWYTVATRGLKGKVNKPIGLHVDQEKDFLRHYNEEYRQALRDFVFQEKGKIVEIGEHRHR